jgi:hypothetical protein
MNILLKGAEIRISVLVLCENSADVGSPDHWRIDAVEEGRVRQEFGPIDAQGY